MFQTMLYLEDVANFIKGYIHISSYNNCIYLLNELFEIYQQQSTSYAMIMFHKLDILNCILYNMYKNDCHLIIVHGNYIKQSVQNIVDKLFSSNRFRSLHIVEGNLKPWYVYHATISTLIMFTFTFILFVKSFISEYFLSIYQSKQNLAFLV